ncbi:MAG TPA: hypothetical protein VGN16_20090 [Acidobacteriaceae bacterium]|jgi:hypothetical protein
MKADLHEEFRRLIDESLAGADTTESTTENDRALREHLHTCTSCQEYLSASNRVIAGLSGFSFEVDPNLHAKVSAAITLRAQQLEAARPNRRRLIVGFLLALALTVVGSLLDLQFGSLIAGFFDVQSALVRHGVLAFSIVPSLCVLLLFPVLTLLSEAGTRRKERVL